ERRAEVQVVLPSKARRERLGLCGGRDDAETVAQPLHGGSGDECASLERVAKPGSDIPRDRREEAAARWCCAVTGVHQEKAASSIRVLRLARCEAGLTEERGLLVAGDPGDRHGRPEVTLV